MGNAERMAVRPLLTGWFLHRVPLPRALGPGPGAADP